PFASIGHKTQDLKWKGGTTRTQIGDNNTFREYVTIHSATADGEVTSVGSRNHILAYCHLAHNVVLGNNVIMSNVATLAGHVMVEDYAIIGGLAAIHQFCRIGAYSIIRGCPRSNTSLNSSAKANAASANRFVAQALACFGAEQTNSATSFAARSLAPVSPNDTITESNFA